MGKGLAIGSLSLAALLGAAIVPQYLGKIGDTAPAGGSQVGARDPTGKLAAINVDGSGNVKVAGSFSAAGAADTVGSTAIYNANSVCGSVATAGQTGAGFFLAAGTLTGTVTPSVSTDSTNGTNGNWTATSFVDISGNKTSSQAFTNPNAFFASGIVLEAGVRYARVCTTAFTSGTASGNLVASTPQPPPPAAGADVTDRTGRLLGVISTGANVIGAVTQSGAPWSDNITQLGGTAIATGNGATSSGTQRVTLSNDSTGQVAIAGTASIQGLGTAGAPSGGVISCQAPSSSATPFPVQTTGSNVLAAQPADTIGTQVNLSVVCASGSGCAANSTALVAMAGAQSASVVFSANAAATMTVVADCSRDGASTWNTAVVNFMTSAGVVSASVVNPTNTDYFLMVPPGCGASTNVRVRVSAYTSGNINAQLRAVTTQSLMAVGDGAKVPKVEAASTAAAAGDQAWAVSLSPNSPLPVRAATTIPTAASDAAAVPVMADKFGRVQVGRIDRGLISKSGVDTLSASTTETTLLAAVASTFLDIFYIHCVTSATTATRIDIRDTTGGTIRDVIECPAAAGDCGGFNQALTPLPQTTVNTNWTIQSSASVTDVRCVAYAEQSK